MSEKKAFVNVNCMEMLSGQKCADVEECLARVFQPIIFGEQILRMGLVN